MDQEMSSYVAESSFNFGENTVICIEATKNQLGCCLLEGASRTLKILGEDQALTEINFEQVNMIVESLILEHDPSVCLVSARLEESSFNYIKSVCQENGCRVELQPNDSFDVNKELEILNSGNYSSFTLLKSMKVNARGSSAVTTSTVNCMLSWLIKCEGADGGDNSSMTLIPNSDNFFSQVETLTLKDRVFIDKNTLYSLNVLPPAQRSGQDKLVPNACFSIWELLGQDLSETGKKLLKSWLIRPLSNKDIIRRRYEILRILLNKTNAPLLNDLRMAVRRIPDILSIMNRFQNGKVIVSSWCGITDFLKRGLEVFRLVSMLQFEHCSRNIFTQILENVNVKALKRLLTKINGVIDLETSREIKTVTIHKGVNERLDECRRVYNDLENILGNVAKDAETTILNAQREAQGLILDVIDENLVNAVYIPQLGYMVTLETGFEESAWIGNQLGWNEVFKTETNIYYKNDRVNQLDIQFGDIHTLIFDIEIDVLHSFQNQILEKRDILCFYGRLLSELEVLMSFAYVSESRNYVEPELLDEDCILEIEEGRHALLETIVGSYIPNGIDLNGGSFGKDTRWFENGHKRIAILTGANQSGKSVFLTQNGLLVLLAHIGCFVPARSARIGIVDKILSRIQTRETISNNESSFALDSLQMAKCLSLATEKSLVLIDEFGKGTDIVDGPAIFGSIISVMAVSQTCPRIIASTHFHELFKCDVLTENISGVRNYTTEILLSRQNDRSLVTEGSGNEDNFGITFLYSVREGISRQSFGIYCAQLCGVDETIISRANELVSLMNQGYNLVEHCCKLTESEVEQFQQNQDMAKKFLKWDLDLETATDINDLREKLRSLLKSE